MAATTKQTDPKTQTELVTCPECGGVGLAWDFIHRLQESVLDKCATCNGRGVIYATPKD